MAEQTIRGYHLSRQQKRIWPLLKDRTAFAVQAALLLTGRLERERLRQSVARVLGRHEILRSTFQQPSGLKLPIQVVGDEAEPAWREIDVAVGDASLHDVVEMLLRRDREEPLRVVDRCPLRFTLGAVDGSHHILVITASPLVADLESLYLAAEEAIEIYVGARDSGDEEPLQYAAFAAWQAEVLEDEEATLGRKYWRSQDVAALFGVDHPLVRHRSDSGDERVERIERALDADLVSAIDDLARQTARTDQQLFLSCWCALLGRLTGSAELGVACRINGRTDEELETAIGPFAGFVPLRYRVEDGVSFQAIVDHIVDSRDRARDWEPYFDWEDVAADSVNRESPTLPFAFEYRYAPADTEVSGIGVSRLHDFEYLDRFHLKLSCSRRGDAVGVDLHFAAAAWSREDALRVVDQFEAALRGVVRSPAGSFAEVDILGPEEWTRTVEDLNATRVESRDERCVHDLFEAQVARCPDRCAVVYEDGVLTYRALDERASALAARLRVKGIGAGTTVGICAERSADMIVAILGILKAGGAYVPLDPSLPKLRLETLLRESRTTTVVSHRALAAAFHDIDVIVLDDLLRSEHTTPAPNAVKVAPENLAYVLFTSGTTGVPKGVAVEHRQIVNYARGVAERLGVSDGEHMATVSTFAADLGNTVVYAALITGGTLHVVSEHRRSNPDALAQYFSRWRIDCLKVVPSHLEALLSASAPQHVLSIRRIVLGGEATPWTLIDRIEALSSAQVFNHYGPTETTVGATTCRLSRNRHDPDSGTLPIGRPLPDYRAYILGSGGRPTPIGVIGDLHIGGGGVARGYLNRPAETAERFVPDPFGSAGQRLYRTGDRARHLRGGDIEFRGRADDQVKIRGYRVEQAEVEAVVASCPSVRQAVVVALREAGGDARLVAYVVLGQTGATVADVTAFVGQRLPDYMVPSVFITLPSLPLNRNGKVDRRALPAPDASTARESVVAPRTAVEQRLAGIWSDLLRIDGIGVRDSFFDRGGHSLSAMQLVSRIRQQFDVELPLLSIFETPTIEAIAAKIEESSGQSSKASMPSIAAARRDGFIPASFSQERLWLFDQLQPGNSAYNVPAAVQIGGALDVAALEQTFAAVVSRHEVLRTTFSSIDGRPVQVIAPDSPARLAFIDLRALSAPERARHVEALARAHAQHPFDLAKGPVWRATLVQLAADEHVVLWNQHHISSDGWSAAIFVRELSRLYTAFAGGGLHGLTPLAIQYADFSQWQRDWLDGEGKSAQSEYWRQRLADAPPALVLPTDRPHPPVQSFRGESESVVLSPELSRALVALGRQEGATTYITLLSALNALLYLYTGQTDIIVGSPTAGRSHGQTEDLIGFFLNTLALRTRVKGDASFRELLRDVRTGVLEAFANQDLPFEHIIDTLQIERDRSRSVLYQVLFNHQRASEARLTFGDLHLAPIDTPTVSSKFDLTLYATEGTEQTALRMVYNVDVFDRSTIAAMLGRFVVLLEAVAANPDRPVSGLPLLTDDQRMTRPSPELLSARRPAAEGFRRDEIESTITQRFERQVEAYPDRVAVKTRRHEWTYRQLAARASGVAGRIHAAAGDSAAPVGLLFEKGAPLMAGILGVLQSGRAYVPLDPSNPRDRLSYMLKHSEAGILLADDPNLRFARELAGDAVAVVGIEDAGTNEDRRPVVIPASPDSIAYILYTSGSTGVPKGVVQNHRNVLHFMQVYTNNLGIRSGDRLSLLSSYGFDGAVMDIFGALLNGATLLPATLLEDGPEGVMRQLVDERVTVFHSTPTVFRQLFGDGSDSGEFPHVRIVVLGGEEAVTGDLELFKRRFGPATVLVNGLGPSESTVTLQHFMTGDTVNRRRSLPVGLPVEDTEIVLLSAAGTPTDVYGEIAIRSRHVALGYWRDEEKTRSAFTTEPDADRRRVYRTGDIGRRLPDGTLEFVGRKDSQVKIRGFRIELGEVESVLGGHPSVQECAVLARADKDGPVRLVAYVRPTTSQADVAADLRSFLKQKLPDYMVPAAFVIQASLPVTANGKLDRDALPNVDVKAEAEVEFIAPRTTVERRMAGLWGEVLGAKRVGVGDDFFAIGGQSLLAMRLISRIRSSFEIELPLRLLFESPTLEGMARHVETALSGARHERRRPPIESAPRDGRLPLSFAQQRMWILDQLEPGGATYNVPAAVELHGSLQLGALEQAIDAIVLRHEVLRTTFRKSDQGEPEQVIGKPERRGMPVIDLAGLSSRHVEQTLDRLAQHEARYPFDLTVGPLLRVATLRVTDQRHVVLFTMHHIVSDAWSTGVLVRELSELYQSLVAGRESALPPLPIQYADYAAWQRRWLESDSVQEQLQYWKRQLDGIPEQLALPLDRPRGAEVTYNGAREAFDIEGPLVGSLASLGRDEGTTLFVSLLAVFQMLLHRYTGQHDIVVGAPIAGRNTAETEPLIGFFINTLVLRARIDPMRTFRDLLREVHETVLNATANQDLPFERLVDELNPARGVGRTPLFQVAFVLQNAPREALTMSDLTLRNRPVETRTSKFDWTVSLIEVADGIAGHIEYNTDLFDGATLRRVARDYENLVKECIANPDRVIADLEVVDGPGRQRLLAEWNDSTVEYPASACLHQWFEEQVERAPDRVAVILDGHQVTYRALSARANQLAHHLRSLGVGPEVLVGLYLERSIEMVVGILGILKAGGAYVPLDPAHPTERLAFMVADAGIDVLVTEDRLAGGLPETKAHVLSLDGAWQAIARERATVPAVETSVDSVAYVIYTSGSTGTPKGTPVTHRNVARLFAATDDWFAFGERDVWTLFHSYAFDFSVWELWGALCYGGRLVIVPYTVSRTPENFVELLARERVTVLNQTPSAFRQLVTTEGKHPPNRSLSALRYVVFGGEALEVSYLAPWISRYGSEQPRLINMYGITETTVHVTYRPITPADLEAPRVDSPVGRPIPDLQLYVRDAYGKLSPTGVAGELFVGGAGVARGYHGRPALTAERFVPSPYVEGARLYRTGDGVRYLADGQLGFLGRIDQQVKIRGFRIELGEIEATLAAQDGVRDVVVLAREDVPGDQRLVAYLVVDALRSPSTSDLRSALRRRLPDYMVPSAFVPLDALPLTPNGKVDRRALPEPGQAWGGTRAWVDASSTASRPSTSMEVAVARIWKSVLRTDNVSLDDKFFDLGGHSLNAIQVLTKIEQELGCQVKFNDLIFQTLRQVAAACARQLADQAG